MPSQDRVILYEGIDEAEALRVGKREQPRYAKVVAKALGGVLLYGHVQPIVR